jgi:hypothetical protein
MTLSFLRPFILVFILAALLPVSAALAAPTCQDVNGITTRCGTPNAMPVGWTLSPQQALERQASRPQYPTTIELLKLICIMGVIFSVMALMPDFDGSREGDWDAQEGDDKKRK